MSHPTTPNPDGTDPLNRGTECSSRASTRVLGTPHEADLRSISDVLGEAFYEQRPSTDTMDRPACIFKRCIKRPGVAYNRCVTSFCSCIAVLFSVFALDRQLLFLPQQQSNFGGSSQICVCHRARQHLFIYATCGVCVLGAFGLAVPKAACTLL